MARKKLTLPKDIILLPKRRNIPKGPYNEEVAQQMMIDAFEIARPKIEEFRRRKAESLVQSRFTVRG